MVKVSIEVRSEAARFSVRVQAATIQRAESIAKRRFPGGDLRVKFPIDPEAFFIKDFEAKAGIVGFEQPDEIVA